MDGSLAYEQDGDVDSLASKLHGKMVLSIDTIDWDEAGELEVCCSIKIGFGKTCSEEADGYFSDKGLAK